MLQASCAPSVRGILASIYYLYAPCRLWALGYLQEQEVTCRAYMNGVGETLCINLLATLVPREEGNEREEEDKLKREIRRNERRKHIDSVQQAGSGIAAEIVTIVIVLWRWLRSLMSVCKMSQVFVAHGGHLVVFLQLAGHYCHPCIVTFWDKYCCCKGTLGNVVWIR